MSDLTDVTRRLVAVFAADVEGYSRLMGADEVGTLKGLTERRAILDRIIGEHRGRIANTAGDSVLAEFGSAVDAVKCAVEAQAALAEANSGLAPDRRISFRIGVHIGDVMIRAGDLFGDGVNIAARLQALAKPGGVCISGATYDQVRKVLPIAFGDLGAQQVKNIQEPIRAYQVVTNSEGNVVPSAPFGTPRGPPPTTERASIAVLPFQNMSGDPEQEYFADGIVEDIITALSRFRSLSVAARTSSFIYKGKAVDVKQVGRELEARYVLEGSVRKAGGRVRITGQLIEAATGAHLWADKFDGAMEEVFDLQDRVTSNVVGAVAPAVQLAELERSKRNPPANLESYDLYLRGLALFYLARSREAADYFKKAIAKDDQYAEAYGMVGLTYAHLQANQGVPILPEERAEAIRCAEVAAALGGDDALTLARAAWALVYLGKEYERGSIMIERAVALNPNQSTVWLARGWISAMCGDGERAMDSFSRIMRLSQVDPVRLDGTNGLAWACFILKRYGEGCSWAMQAQTTRSSAIGLSGLIINAVSAGRMNEARSAAARLAQKRPNFRSEHAVEAFPTRDAKLNAMIAERLREAGVPE